MHVMRQMPCSFISSILNFSSGLHSQPKGYTCVPLDRRRVSVVNCTSSVQYCVVSMTDEGDVVVCVKQLCSYIEARLSTLTMSSSTRVMLPAGMVCVVVFSLHGLCLIRPTMSVLVRVSYSPVPCMMAHLSAFAAFASFVRTDVSC